MAEKCWFEIPQHFPFVKLWEFVVMPNHIHGIIEIAKKITPDWGWQPRFYDHIIRDEKSYGRISNYIINNPLKWNKDKFYKNDNNTVMEPLSKYGNSGNYSDVF